MQHTRGYFPPVDLLEVAFGVHIYELETTHWESRFYGFFACKRDVMLPPASSPTKMQHEQNITRLININFTTNA